ncbi:MAG: hypothetical protein FWH42_05490 [Dehalococcoidia bacterium]|nr:hypothetical protein [Dehalococcoidia bacterium]
MSKFRIFKWLFPAIMSCLLLTTAFGGAVSAAEDKSVPNGIIASVQVIHDPAMLALYDEEALVDNEYFNADSLEILYAGLEQAVDQEAYFNSLPEDAKSAIIASYVTSEGYVEFDHGVTRGSGWATTSYTAKNVFGGTLYSYSLKMYWTGTGTSPSNGIVSNVSGETTIGGGFGWGFKGEYLNPTSGYKNYSSHFWVQTGADFANLGFHQYVSIEMSLYSDGTTEQPDALVTGSSPLWYTLLNAFSLILPI